MRPRLPYTPANKTNLKSTKGGGDFARGAKLFLAGLPVLISLFLITYFIDVYRVLLKGYEEPTPYAVFISNGFVLYLLLAVVFWLLSPIAGKIFRTRYENPFFAGFASWWIFVTLLFVLYVNEELIGGRLGFGNPESIVFSILSLAMPLAILKYVSGRVRGVYLSGRGMLSIYAITFFMLLIIVVMPFLLNAIGPDTPATPSEGDSHDVILITLDTLRADHLNIYGYEPETSPSIDEFARDCVVFDACFTPMPLTNPAHASMFTGNLPQNHLVLTNTSAYEQIPTIKPDGTAYENMSFVEILREQGYDSFAAVSAVHLGNEFGWGKSFTSLNQYTPPFKGHFANSVYQLAPMRFIAKALRKPINYIRKSDEVFATFLQWDDWRQPVSGREPFFAWLHCFDVHVPYNPPGGLERIYMPDYSGSLTCSGPDVQKYNTDRDELLAEGADLDEYIQYANACYDGEIRFMDEQFGMLIDELKKRGIYNDSLIIVCADHGEGIGERDFIGHNSVLVDYETRVPMFIKPPGYSGGGARVKLPVSLCDIAPTVYDFLGIDSSLRMDGESLKPLVDGEPGRGFGWPMPGMIFLKSHSLRWKDRQIMRNIEPETEAVVWSYYDLRTDPGAFVDLYATEGLLPERDKTSLLEWIEGTSADFAYLAGKAHEKEELDEWTIEQLRANGYLN